MNPPVRSRIKIHIRYLNFRGLQIIDFYWEIEPAGFNGIIILFDINDLFSSSETGTSHQNGDCLNSLIASFILRQMYDSIV